jgi:ribose/xylose/arabinose/galactoside ABC-type transport system permease subunit
MMKIPPNLTRTLALLAILLFLGVIAAILSPLFLRLANIRNLFIQVSFTGILAIGMTFVILTGGIDLSVGSIVGFSSILFATLLHGSFFTFMPKVIFAYGKQASVLNPLLPLPLDLLVVVIIAAIIGLISGGLSYYLKIHSFIITLGMLFAVRGLALSYTNGQPLYGVPKSMTFMAYGFVLGLPVTPILWLVLLVAGAGVLTFTRYGRRIYAVGGNEQVARLSGITPIVYRITPFLISGVCAGLVGILMSGRMGAGDPTIANGWELDAIGAVVIGGTRLEGGRGSLLGTLIGVLIVGVVTNAMDLLGMKAYPQQMVKGAMIVGAVALQNVLGSINRTKTR